MPISKSDAKTALRQHLQALALPGWEQLRLFSIGSTKSALTMAVRTWSTQESMAALLQKQNAERRNKLGQIKKLVIQVSRENKEGLDPYVFGNADVHQRCREIRRLARELLNDYDWPQKRPPKRDSFLAGIPPAGIGATPVPSPPRWHRLKRRTQREPSANGLRYHQAVFGLLQLTPEIAKRNVNRLEYRERKCGLKFPASVFELYSLRYIDEIFFDNTNQDALVKLNELGRQLDDDADIGILDVAIENQGVVSWHVPLGQGDDPPVLQAPDGIVSKAEIISTAFSNFVFDIVANNCFHGAVTGLRLMGKAALPDRSLLNRLRRTLYEGPRTRHGMSIAYRFFAPGGVLRVFSNTPRDRARSLGDWTIEAESEDLLFEIAREVWHYADVSQKIKATASNAESNSKVRELLRQLRKL